MYINHFTQTDSLIEHLDTVLPKLANPLINSQYTGFLAVCAVTVIELSIKSIFIDFSHRKHVVLGTFCENFFERINGRVALHAIQNDYLPKFGKKYEKRFQDRLKRLEEQSVRTRRASIKASYGNLITWRNKFAHEGELAPNASYDEIKAGYNSGKEIMQVLAQCFIR